MANLISSFLLALHIFAGSISLILFWIPAFTRKRKGVHTLVGKWYVLFMWIVVITAALLSIKNLLIGRYEMAMFLGFLSLVTGNPLWHARSVMKNKRQFSSSFIKWHIISHSAIIILGTILLISGIFFIESGTRYLMMFFGTLGVLDIREVIKAKSMASAKPDWYRIHYSGMITTGIAAYTAFLAFGGRAYLQNVLTNEWQLLPWIAPTVIGIVFIRIMDRRRKAAVSR